MKLVGAYSITAFSVHLNRGIIASKLGGHTAVASWVRRAPPRTSNCPLPGMRLSSVDLYGQQPVILKVTSAQRPIPIATRSFTYQPALLAVDFGSCTAQSAAPQPLYIYQRYSSPRVLIMSHNTFSLFYIVIQTVILPQRSGY